jgi:succinate dehydrogenase / fumarate reductase cytochrome b subunit
MTMVVSILHRVSGLALSLGLVVLVAWLLAAANGPAAHERFIGAMGSGWGRLLLALLSFAFFFHLANGVRHLVWDVGFGFEIPQANASGWSVIAATIVLTLAYWLAL